MHDVCPQELFIEREMFGQSFDLVFCIDNLTKSVSPVISQLF